VTGPPPEMPVEKLRTLFATFVSCPTNEKGKALEDFCETFFEALPGVTVWQRDLHDDLHSQELDLVLDNEPQSDGLDLLGRLIFLEAKNWRTRVGSAEVAWLDWKVRLAGEFYGILVAAEGVTGRSDDLTSAWRILREAKREGRHLFVMLPAEMLACATVEDFRQLIKRKRMQLATGKAPLDEMGV
jgi:hypothetical protein